MTSSEQVAEATGRDAKARGVRAAVVPRDQDGHAMTVLARAIAETLSGGRLLGYPGFRDIVAHATGGVVAVSLDNGMKFEMRLNVPKKERLSNG